MFVPAISCLLSSLVLGCLCRGMWLSRAPSSPAHHGREIFAVPTLKCVNGALQGAVFTFVCRNDFFLVPGFSRWLCDQEFCCCFVVPPWSRVCGPHLAYDCLDSLQCIPLFHPLPV